MAVARSSYMRRAFCTFLSMMVLVGCSSSDGASGGSGSGIDGTAVGTVRIRLKNAGTSSRYAVLSSVNGSLRGLSVLGLDYAPSPHLGDLCGGDGTHDDPSYRAIPIQPSGSVEYTWGVRTGGAAAITR